jgi:ABC-type Fe3+ transport system substrate-binding protein
MKHGMKICISAMLLAAVELATTGSGSAAEPFKAQWAALSAEARREGELNVIVGGGSGRDMSKGWQAAFGDKYGVKIKTFLGRSRDHWERVKAERSAKIYSVDAWVTSGRFPQDVLVPAGVVQPIMPLLIHPEVIDPGVWYRKRHWWADDDEKYAYTFWGNGGFASIPYNTKLMPPPEVKKLRSWTDLGRPEFTGQIIVRHHTHDIFACQFVVYGESWFRTIWVNQKPKVQGNDRQGAEWLARGVGKVGLGIGNREVEELKAGGLPVEPQLPHPLDNCNNLSSASGNIVIFDRPKNPSAAKLLLNWLLTKEGQYASQKDAGADSLRVDIPKDNVREADRRLDGVEYVFECCEKRFKEATKAALNLRYKLGVQAGLWQ